jgi:light-regulated signal transduction histidine kinase (bacteriophytochrome)
MQHPGYQDTQRNRRSDSQSFSIDLERRVIVRTAQVDELNRELEAFNDSISHDLQTPLRRISGFVNALGESVRRPVGRQRKELILEICAPAQHISTLIKALLKLSLSWDKEIQWVPIELGSIAHVVAKCDKPIPSAV